MIWAQAYETNLDCLRRYAAFSCGCQGLGDNVVHDALMDVLGTVSSAETENRLTLFQKVEASLRNMPGAEAALFDALGRWRLLSPLERRMILLNVIEGFSIAEVARITSLPKGEVKAVLGRARMIYADRLPARVGLIGGSDAIRAAVESTLHNLDYSLLWAVAAEDAGETASLAPASLVVVVQEGASPFSVEQFCSGYTGPVILAHACEGDDRLSSRLWTLPLDSLADETLFSSILVHALLFSD
ncbi:sigma factor-like helix-turn-helix DNA-binding protein [Hyphomonas sp.]|uniref:sigma factor-like helix-turn-helix DNA-binding protein n=1 Tax=Hyphomonas sp. TaxID=87 RepID=UPI0035288244